MNFSRRYPRIAAWINSRGWIEVGTDENADSLIRLMDEGGLWWQSDDEIENLDEALQKAEDFLGQEEL